MKEIFTLKVTRKQLQTLCREYQKRIFACAECPTYSSMVSWKLMEYGYDLVSIKSTGKKFEKFGDKTYVINFVKSEPEIFMGMKLGRRSYPISSFDFDKSLFYSPRDEH